MPKPIATAEQKAEALRLYVEVGAAEAARSTGIPRATISQWARRSGVTGAGDTDPTGDTASESGHVTVTEQRRARVQGFVEAHRLTMAERRAKLAEHLMDDALRLRTQFWEPAVSQHWGTTSTREAPGIVTTTTQFMEHPIPEPTFADKDRIASSLSKVIDKMQLLSGEATERTEANDSMAARQRIEEIQAQWRRRAEERAQSA